MEVHTSSLEHIHPKLNMEFPHHHTVNVVEEFQISPPLGSVPTTTLPLTVYDINWFLFPFPVRFLFFYEFHHPKTYFMETIFPNIKHSLSLTLQHFYPLAGNLTWPQESTLPEIHYESGDTLPLTLAESSDYDDDYFYTLSGNQARDASMFVPLIPKLRSRSSEKVGPLSAIQVTLFPNKGISIGLASNHVVADGKSITHFIKSWASICRLDGDASLKINNSLPFYDRSTLKQLNQEKAAAIMLCLEKLQGISKDTFNNIMHNYDQKIVPVDNVQATFMMLTPDIKKLKQLVLSKENEILHSSSLVVTCACVWVCLIKARESSSSSSSDDSNVSDDNMDYYILPVDLRSRLNVPLTYFGNCIDCVIVATKTSSLTGADGIVFAAKLISDAIFRKMNVNDETNEKVDMPNAPPDHITMISSSPKFGVYETDYGWGKPKKVEFISEGSITISDSLNVEGGFEIGFTRNKIEMDAFASIFAKSLAALS